MLSQDPLAKNAPRLNPKKWILHGQFQTISLSFHYYALRTATRHLLPTYWFPASSSTKLHFLRFLRMFYKVWKEICFLMKDIWIFGLKLDIWKKNKPLHIVWKLLKMSHLNFWNLAFSNNFCPIKTDLSGNTVWPQASGFQRLAKLDHFLAFFINFCPLKM